MALAPRFAGQRRIFGTPQALASSVPPTRHTLELFLDYCCSFSAKLFNTVSSSVVPVIQENSDWASKIDITFRQQIQPWHPSSTLLHEAALAVLRVAPASFWDFSKLLFQHQKEYFDENVVDETRNNTYKRLAKLAASMEGVEEGKVYDLLKISNTPAEDGSLNVGNAITADVKLITKMHRLVGTHVTPAVIFDGVVQSDISSSWTVEQWKEFLAKNLV